MKKIYITIIGIFMATAGLYAQTNLNIGAGYFGKHASYPGLVLEAEMEQMFSEKVSVPLRLDMGFYVQIYWFFSAVDNVLPLRCTGNC